VSLLATIVDQSTNQPSNQPQESPVVHKEEQEVLLLRDERLKLPSAARGSVYYCSILCFTGLHVKWYSLHCTRAVRFFSDVALTELQHYIQLLCIAETAQKKS